MEYGTFATNSYYGNARIWAPAIRFSKYIIYHDEHQPHAGELSAIPAVGNESRFNPSEYNEGCGMVYDHVEQAIMETDGGKSAGKRNRFGYIQDALRDASKFILVKYGAAEGKTMKDYMVRITEDVEVQLDCERYLLERGDRIAVISPRLINAFKWMLKDAKIKDVYDHDNMLTICDGLDSFDVFIANLGMPVARNTKIMLSDGRALLQIGDRLMVEAVPTVGITGRMPFRSIGQFAKQYAKWSDKQIQQRIGDIKSVANPRHQRAMIKQWISEIQKGMSAKAKPAAATEPAAAPAAPTAAPAPEAKPEEKPEDVMASVPTPAAAPADDEEAYKIVDRYEELESPMTNYAKSPFIMRSREAGEKLVNVIGRALTANKVQSPEMEVVRAEFGAAEGRHEFKYVIVYRAKPDQVQELMTMGAAAAMVASKGQL